MTDEQRRLIGGILIDARYERFTTTEALDRIEQILSTPGDNSSIEDEIANILKEVITFVGQVDNYIIHGAIEKIKQLVSNQVAKATAELEARIKELEDQLKRSNYDPDFNG